MQLELTSIALLVFISYLLGSIPSAVWIGKRFHGTDVREHGSGNAGATNTFRVLGKKTGTAVLMADVLKGYASSLLVLFLPLDNYEQLTQYRLLFGAFAVLGHIYPLFAQFKGGKGIATLLGVVIGLNPLLASISVGIFLMVLMTTHYVSLGSMLATIAFPLFALWLPFVHRSFWLIGFGVLASLMVVLTHRKNIERLLAGNESKTYLFQRKKG
jgi:glycerol-3-phosphate acyltransferase PlsY